MSNECGSMPCIREAASATSLRALLPGLRSNDKSGRMHAMCDITICERRPERCALSMCGRARTAQRSA